MVAFAVNSLPYKASTLQWETFGQSIPTHKASPTTDDTGKLQQSITEKLQAKRWSLAEQQQRAPLLLPPTHLDSVGGSRVYSLNDFVKQVDKAAAQDLEASAAANRNNGDRGSRLSQEQLQEMHKYGRLTIPSAHFRNQSHTFQVVPAFYSGVETIHASAEEGLGKALDHVLCYSKDAVVGNRTNPNKDRPRGWRKPALGRAVLESGRRTIKTLRQATSQLSGLAGNTFPKYSAVSIERLLECARQAFVLRGLCRQQQEVAESPTEDGQCQELRLGLLFDPKSLLEHTEDLDALWDELDLTGLVRDIRPSKDVMEQHTHDRRILKELRYDFETNVAPQQYNEMLELDQQTHPSAKAVLQEKKRVDQSWLNQRKNQLWIEHLESNRSNDAAVAQAEARRLRALQVEVNTLQMEGDQIHSGLADYRRELQRRHPALTLSQVWLERRMDQKREELTQELASTRTDRVVKQLDDAGFRLHASARRLADDFDETLGKTLQDKLAATKTTFHPACFDILQLNPNKWTLDDQHGGLKMYKRVAVSLDKPFWRWRYYVLFGTQIMKGMVGGASHFLTAGPLSLRALLCRLPYYAVDRPVRDQQSLTSTWQSRLGAFYSNLRESRLHFERQPDTGLIGKSIQRFFLHVSHAVQVAVGTVAISGFMILGTLASSLMCTVVLVGAPVLAAVAITIVALFNIIFLDTAIAAAGFRGAKVCRAAECDRKDLPSAMSPVMKLAFVMPYNILITGILQGVLATLRATLWHPGVAAARLLWTFARFSFRTLRDKLTWQILRRNVRVPSSDSFLAWRTHGPGMSSQTYYRLPLDAAKMSVVLALDRVRLAAHSQIRRAELDAPVHSYASFFENILAPFAFGSVWMNTPYPSSVADEITRHSPRETIPRGQGDDIMSRPQFHEHMFDIWDGIAVDIRSSDPSFEADQRDYQNSLWHDMASVVGVPLEQLDKEIVQNVDLAFRDYQNNHHHETPDWVLRPARLCAIWNFQSSIRDQRLADSISIPPTLRGQFRMSKADCDDLWVFTVERVKEFAKTLRIELQDVAAKSAFSERLMPVAKQAMDSFYQRAGASPGQKDTTLVAALLLKSLLGGEDALETLQERDEHFVLEPIPTTMEEHLGFTQNK